MTVRLLVVLGVIALTFGANRIHSRRPVKGAHALAVGLTIVEVPGCRTCVVVMEALTAHGIPYSRISADEATDLGIDVRTAPTAIVTSREGTPVMVRRGRDVIDNLGALADTARKALG